MILVITHSSDATADFMCARLARDGLRYSRLDSDTASKLVQVHGSEHAVRLLVGDTPIDAGDLTCVWLRRPKAISVEANADGERLHASSEWSEAIEGFLAQVPANRWINEPSRNARASHKLDQLRTAVAMGLHVPSTLVTQDSTVAKKFFAQHGDDVVTKPLYSGYIERARAEEDTSIFTSRVEASHLDLSDLLRRCPTLFQARVSKAFDVRVSYVDGRLQAVRMDHLDSHGRQILDVRRNSMKDVSYTQVEVPAETTTRIQLLVEHYSLRFAAIDFAVTPEDEWVFFEINPNGQWAWLDLAGVADIAGDLAWAMTR